MPIRLNLLAEAQAAEELRRKDPVKRTLWAAGMLAALLLLWCAVLQVRVMAARSELNSLQQQWKSLEKANQQTVANGKKTIEIESKLAALERLSTNRFLWGNAFNALQQTLNGIDEVQFIRLRTEQTFVLTEEPKSRAPATNATHSATNKPPTATEKITLIIEAMDSSAQPGSQVNKFKETIAAEPFFAQNLQKTNGVLLTTLSPPQTSPSGANTFVLFSLQCACPEKVRR